MRLREDLCPSVQEVKSGLPAGDASLVIGQSKLRQLTLLNPCLLDASGDIATIEYTVPELDHVGISSNLLILLLHRAANWAGTRTIWRKCVDHRESQNP